ncbi:GyrI-like domain-containing protein [Chitinophaga sedimenti]|uniref:GyrI-like domain-containing protein n=1 Tax=Chitinophaga sedimenti TaxID=2033606 RepID=UPI00200505C0|nr:GyrI-like domain-containing protein [Chitinophaga sedimenti]MCK7559044.1 GyrI-like domain-containing protein [Chitinophaga sedimenti]
MTNLDLTRTYPRYYKAAPRPELVTIPAGHFLTIEGQGDPDKPPFAVTVGALYAVAYSIRALHKQQGNLFTVPKLEGLWWINVNKPFETVSRDEWFWKLLIQMPAFVSAADFRQAAALAFKKKAEPQIEAVKFENIEEGLCVQMLHAGPYADEPATVGKIREYMDTHNLVQNGLHHEIYLTQPGKAAPEKMRTILRFPVK